MKTATEKTWEDMTAEERNNLIGELIGAKPVQQLYLALDGARLWPLVGNVDELEPLRKVIAQWQAEDKAWASWKNVTPNIQEEWRNKLSVEVVTWHIRYSEVPAGGWAVLEHLRKKGFPVTIYSEPADNWRVLVKERAGDRAPGVNAVSPDIHVAACEVARRILDR